MAIHQIIKMGNPILRSSARKLTKEEIISVEKVLDDTETVDDFVNDLNAILQKKGEKIEKETKKYTLFDDAIEEE